MALLNQLDVVQVKEQLRPWLAEQLPDCEEIELTGVNIPQSAGMSMTTVLFAAHWIEHGAHRELELAARVAPSGPPSFKNPDLTREFRLLRILGEHTGVRVPTARWLEEDPAVLGSPFMVLDRAYGEVPGDDPPHVVEGWVLDLPVAERSKLHRHTLDTIRDVHAVDWRGLGCDFLDEPEFGPTGIEQQIGHWDDFYDWAREDTRSATIDAGFAWMREHAPHDEELVLCWGDARIGNVMFAPEDLSVRAVFDWEMATIASPEMDLGWFLFFLRYYVEGIGVPPVDGFPTRDELIARYEEITGRQVAHADYYEAFAALRLSILLMRAGRLMIAAGALPDGNPMPFNNPASQMLAQLLQLPAPDGDVANFLGNR